MIELIECFRTFQGEGPDSGRAMLLLRFKHCDQNCFFCDTKVKMRISEEGTHSISQLQTRLYNYRCGLLITGGEPTFTPHYKDTINLLENLNYSVANVETNGCQLEKLLNKRDWTQKPVKFIYSPKIFDETTSYNALNLTNLILNHQSVYIKVPYLDNVYVDAYCKWLSKEISNREKSKRCDYNEFDNKVWLSPIGHTADQQKKNSGAIMDACEKYKFNFSGRTHIMYDFI
jgi:organic radical activating enzyme